MYALRAILMYAETHTQCSVVVDKYQRSDILHHRYCVFSTCINFCEHIS